MPDVLLIGDTERLHELRHEIPVPITDPFVYAEVGGARHVVIWSVEVPRIRDAGVDAVFHTQEELGLKELLERGLDRIALVNELWLRSVRLVGLESAVVPREFPLGAADHLRANGVELTVDQRFFDARRRVKTPAQLEGIRRAQKAAEAGMAAARGLLRSAEPRDGVLVLDGGPLTCERLKEEVHRAFERLGASADEAIVSHGPQTAIGHDAGSGPIAADDVLILDLFPRDRASGCYADMTRTFAVGDPGEEIRSWHALALRALEVAVAAIRPGVTGREVFDRVCDLFEAHGHPTMRTAPDGEPFQEGFYHGLGHGVGLAVHEQPGLGMLGEELVAGDVLAVEPGLYRPGLGGVRVEDLVLVTQDGCEVLTDFPYVLSA